MKPRGRWSYVDLIGPFVSISAGVYLLQTSGSVGDTSWFEVIAHGMGAYFIAKGVFMGRSSYFAAAHSLYLYRLVTIAEGDDDD